MSSALDGVSQSPIETAPAVEPAVPVRPIKPYNDRWLALAGIVVLGGISRIAYSAGFVRPYPLERYFNIPLLDLAKINGHTAWAANGWAFTWIVLFACYYLAFRLAPGGLNVSRSFRRVAIAIICGWAAIFCIDLIQMYPVGAADLFDQIFRARLTIHYNLNPFTTLPRAVPGDPFRPFVAWQGDPSPYGALWETLAAGASAIAGNSLWNNLIIFKLLVTTAYGASVALTYGVLRSFRPEWALRGTLFFAWNPLVLFEVAGNGHNDAIVMAALLAAVYFLVRGVRPAVLTALAAGALTKFVPVLLVPLAAAAIFRDRAPLAGRSRSPLTTKDTLLTLATGTGASIGLAVLLYAPFWNGTSTIGALGRQNLFTASLPKVLVDFLQNEVGLTVRNSETIVRNGALGLVVVVTLGFTIWLLLRRNAIRPMERKALLERTLVANYEIIFVYLAFATLWFQPWYVIWLVALTAPTASYTRANRTVLFCIGGVLNYLVWDFVWLWNRTDIRTNQITSAIAIYTFPLLYTLYVWLRPRWEKGPQATVVGHDQR